MEKFKLIPAVHLILIKDNKVLLLRRFNTGYEDGNYSVPAGHLDGNESATSAMAREALEEACVRINSKDFEVVHVMHRKAETERVDFFLVAKNYEGELKIGEVNKCDDLSWFPLNGLPNNMVPYVRYGIECYQNHIFYSEFGW
ncbi:MAG: NUDIX domain-containing protein [Candidatus Paceibacterota bacterium]